MSSAASLAQLAQEALILAIAVSLPALGAALVVGLIVGVLQSALQLPDTSIGVLPRLLAVSAVLALAGPWMGEQIVAFAGRALLGG